MNTVADVLVCGPTVRELIAGGYLAPFRYFAPPLDLEVDNIEQRGGDFERESLSVVVDRPSIVGNAVEHYRQLASGKRALAFCISREHAEHVAEAFIAAGFRAATLHGGLTSTERHDRDKAFRDGALDVLTVVDLVTEGYDVPGVEVVIHLRPTASLALCRQINGRGLRPKPDGTPCLILDHVGNVTRHGLPDEEIEWSLSGRTHRSSRAAPAVQMCPECWCCHAPAPVCPECGYVYPQKARKHAIVECDGTLAEITNADVQRYREAKLRDLVRAAKTMDELRTIGRIRGYHPAWPTKIATIYHKQFVVAERAA